MTLLTSRGLGMLGSVIKLAYPGMRSAAPPFRGIRPNQPGSRDTSIGGTAVQNAPASGAGASDRKPAKSKPVQNVKLPETKATSAPTGATAPSALKTASILPPSSSLGALLGILFGRMLDEHGQIGPSRDAAIGAAAYLSAEQELAERLKAVQEPGAFPTVVGKLPLYQAPLRRPGGLTL